MILAAYLIISVVRHQSSMRLTTTSGLVAALVASPWFIYVFATTGSLMPSSGAAQARLVTLETASPRAWQMLKAVLGLAFPSVYPGFSSLLLLAGAVSLMLLVWLIFRDRSVMTSLSQKLRLQPAFSSWALALATVIVVYPIFFWASHFYQRYSAPLTVLIIPVIGVAITEWLQPRRKVLQKGIIAALPMLFFLWAGLSFHTGKIGNGHLISTGYVKENFPAPYKVGAFQVE